MKRRLGLVALGVGGVLIAHALAPAWAEILGGLGAATAWALWATLPPNTTMRAHVARRLGEVVLRVVSGALAFVFGVVAVGLLLVASWSFVGPRIEAAIDRKTAEVKEAVTPDVPKVDVGSVLDQIKAKVRQP